MNYIDVTQSKNLIGSTLTVIHASMPSNKNTQLTKSQNTFGTKNASEKYFKKYQLGPKKPLLASKQ